MSSEQYTEGGRSAATLPPLTETGGSGNGDVTVLWFADGDPWLPRLRGFDSAAAVRQLGAVLVRARGGDPAPEQGTPLAPSGGPTRLGRLAMPPQLFERGIISVS